MDQFQRSNALRSCRS